MKFYAMAARGNPNAQVTVFQVMLYDVASDESQALSTHGNPTGAEMMGGWVVEDSALDIDEAHLEKGEQWTERGF